MPESELCNGGNGHQDGKEDKQGNGDGGESNVEEEQGRREVSGKGNFWNSRVFRDATRRSFGRKRKRKEKERAGGVIRTVSVPAVARKGRRSEGGGGGYVCFLQPRTKDSPDTPTRDPNSESFSCGMLKTLLERNDFYCEECNPHI